jgi:hypothetical protein
MDRIPALLAAALPRPDGRQTADRPFLHRICGADFGITMEDEVIGRDRIAFSVGCALPDGRHMLEHVIAHVEVGKFVRQIDVEAWDD